MGIAQQMAALQEQVGSLRNESGAFVEEDTSEMTIGQIANGLMNAEKNLSGVSWGYLSRLSADRSVSAESLKGFVGQTKKASLAGFGDFDFRCIGVRHDEKSDGSGNAGFTFISDQIIEQFQCYAEAWIDSPQRDELYETILPSFPDELKNAICSVRKKYYNGPIQTSDETIWLASPIEISLSSELSSSLPKDEGSTYEYFSDGDKRKRIRYTLDDTYNASYWITRCHYNGYWPAVKPDGSISQDLGDGFVTTGLVVCFSI